MSSYDYKINFTAFNYVNPAVEQVKQEIGGVKEYVLAVNMAGQRVGPIHFMVIEDVTPSAEQVKEKLDEVTQYYYEVTQAGERASKPITLYAVDNVSPVAERVKTELVEIESYTMRVSYGAQQMGQMSYYGFRNLIFGAQMGLFYMSMLAGGMIRNESSTIAVEMAQERLNETIRKYGPNSQEAHRAMQQLERTQLYYQRSITYSNLMTVSMGLQMVGMATSIWRYAIPALGSLTGILHGVANAFRTLYASIGPWGLALLATGTVATGMSIYAATRSVELPSTLNINTTSDTDDVLEKYKQRLKRALSQGGSP